VLKRTFGSKRLHVIERFKRMHPYRNDVIGSAIANVVTYLRFQLSVYSYRGMVFVLIMRVPFR